MLDAVGVALIDGVALAVADTAGVDARRGHGPKFAAILVTKVDPIGRRTGHGVVVPGSQAVHLAISGPARPRAAFTDQRAEIAIGQHV